MLLIDAARQNVCVHRQHLSGQESRRVGGEKDRCLCQFFEIAESLSASETRAPLVAPSGKTSQRSRGGLVGARLSDFPSAGFQTS